jgi:hypothetical protein
VTAKVKARLEKVAAREPEFAHILAEVAEHVLSSFGRLMASPDAARHVHEALFYYFEGYQTRDGELLFARIERTVREAVRRAEEAGIPDAEYRIKQFVLEIIDILARAGERYRRDALKGVLTVEKALRVTAFAGLSAAALYSVYSGLYSEAVVSSVASAIALVDVGRFREAVEYVQRAAKALYEAARDVFEQVKVTVQRLVELFVEAVARALAWVDEHKAYLFLMAAVAAGVIALSVALNLWGLIELEKLAHAAVGAPFVAGLAETGGRAAERFMVLAERYEKWRMDEKAINEIINAPLNEERPYLKLAKSTNLPKPLAELRRSLARVEGEAERDAAVVAAFVLYKTLVKNAGAYREWAGWYDWARGLVGREEFIVAAGDIQRLRKVQRRLEEVAEEVGRELNAVLVLYSQSDFYKERPDLLNKLKQLLEVDLGKAEGLAKARSVELSKYSNTNMGTKAYAALLSIARGGIYGHVAMLLAEEGALADIVLSTPATTHWKARGIAGGRGESVDPSRSRRGAAGWEDRAASVLLRFLIGYGEIDPQLLSGASEVNLKFRLIEKGGRKGFQVFRVYGGVEAPVGELWIEKVAYFKVSKEELRRLEEEAKRHKPDLSGIKKIRQTLEWLNTDMSFAGWYVVGGTAHLWQLRWYLALFGGGRVSGGRAGITEEGIKLYVKMRWRREALDRIIAEESKELEPLLGRAVQSWRELVDAIDWSRVLEKVGKLIDELKPWIGPEKWGEAEREGRVRRMLGELALLVHFAEAKRVKYDEQGKEKAVRLARAVEALSGGRIKGNHANELAQAIIFYAGGQKKEAEGLIENLVKGAGVSREEVWDIVQFVLGDIYYEWRAERAVRLARAVETLSGGWITGEHAVRLAKLIIYYAEGYKQYAKKYINSLAGTLASVLKEDEERVRGEIWGIVNFILSDMYCLARDCARYEVVRKFVAPALELIMLDKALEGKFGREEALLYFGEIYATALAGDGSVRRRRVELIVGGELGGGAALLRLATLHLLNQLLPDELKFNVRVYVGEGRYYDIAAYGENAARFMRLLAVTAPSAGGEYLSNKFNEFVEEAKVEVRFNNIRLAKSGVAADLIISEGGAAVKYNVYLRDDIELQFASTDRGRAELAARLLRLAGVNAEVKKEGSRDAWYVKAATDRLAAGREELRKALAEIVREAVARGWVDADKAERWLKKLEEGLTLKEGWPKYEIGLSGSGALVVRFTSTNSGNIEEEAQRFRDMGLVEGVHFTVKMPEGGQAGYVSVLKEGLVHVAFLSVHGKDEQQRRLAADFVEYILQRAKEACGGAEQCAVYEKAKEIVEEGRSRGSLRLEGFEKRVEVDGKTYVVKVTGWGAEIEEKQDDKRLLRLKITAEVGRVEGERTIVNRVVREYTITFGRYGRNNKAMGFAVARADAPGGREADAERLAAVVEALTGVKPKVRRMKDGKIIIECSRTHLDGFMRYAELADAITQWLEETGR